MDKLTKPQLQRLLEVGRSLVTELDLETVLRNLLEAAREMTQARYAALGILDAEKQSLERFLHIGLTEEERRRIGPLPTGKGVLGELIRDPSPLRLPNVGDHPHSYGFPANHPPMTSFVGAPVLIRGEAFGNIYLTEKLGADEFDERDEHMLIVLADWAAVAIDNARLYEDADRRRAELERAVQGLEATVSLSRLVTPAADLNWLLETIAKRGRALVEAEILLLLRDPGGIGGLETAATAGEHPDAAAGTILKEGQTALQALLGDDPIRRLPRGDALPGDLATDDPAIVAVLDNRGRAEGFLLGLKPVGRAEFNSDDELLLSSFASSAAGAIGTIGEVERDRRRLTVEASERERQRWARELHDETLQQLGAMKLLHESALAKSDPEAHRRTIERAVAAFDDAIVGLEGLITELRPAALDDLGTEAAVEALADRVREANDLDLDLEIDLAFEAGGEPTRHTEEVESTVYRVVQEALTNVVKHADATKATVSVVESNGDIAVKVSDDGAGIPLDASTERFGLRGMRERIELVGGTIEFDSEPGRGTSVRATVPATRRA